jgi:hypothetical protein
MLVATRSFVATCPDTGERIAVTAGTSQIIPKHWIPRRWPERFRAADPSDRETQRSLRELVRSARGAGREPWRLP